MARVFLRNVLSSSTTRIIRSALETYECLAGLDDVKIVRQGQWHAGKLCVVFLYYGTKDQADDCIQKLHGRCIEEFCKPGVPVEAELARQAENRPRVQLTPAARMPDRLPTFRPILPVPSAAPKVGAVPSTAVPTSAAWNPRPLSPRSPAPPPPPPVTIADPASLGLQTLRPPAPKVPQEVQANAALLAALESQLRNVLESGDAAADQRVSEEVPEEAVSEVSSPSEDKDLETEFNMDDESLQAFFYKACEKRDGGVGGESDEKDEESHEKKDDSDEKKDASDENKDDSDEKEDDSDEKKDDSEKHPKPFVVVKDEEVDMDAKEESEDDGDEKDYGVKDVVQPPKRKKAKAEQKNTYTKKKKPAGKKKRKKKEKKEKTCKKQSSRKKRKRPPTSSSLSSSSYDYESSSSCCKRKKKHRSRSSRRRHRHRR